MISEQNLTAVELTRYTYMQGESPTYILNEDTQLVIRAVGVSHTACKDEFRQDIRSHSWSVFSLFYNIFCGFIIMPVGVL